MAAFQLKCATGTDVANRQANLRIDDIKGFLDYAQSENNGDVIGDTRNVKAVTLTLAPRVELDP
jgi:hypothetical protein